MDTIRQNRWGNVKKAVYLAYQRIPKNAEFHWRDLEPIAIGMLRIIDPHRKPDTDTMKRYFRKLRKNGAIHYHYIPPKQNSHYKKED